MKKHFWGAYVIFVALLIGGSYHAITYVYQSICLYEDSLPEKVVEKTLDNLYDCLNNNSDNKEVMEYIHFPEELEHGSEYTDPLILEGDYIKEITGKEFGYHFAKDDYATGNKEYIVTIEDEPVAKMVLEFLGEERRLGILAITDMKLKEIQPVMQVDSFNYDFIVLDNHNIIINDKQVPKSNIIETKDISTYQYLYDYAPMPRITKYRVENIFGLPDIRVINDDGVEISYKEENGVIDTSDWLLESGDTVPQSILEEIDIIKAAKTWSLFTTKDLPGANYGLETVRKYFIKDSYYWNKLGEYARGIDISYVSAHSYPTISNEVLSEYKKYNDKCFSCRVKFDKQMIVGYGKKVDDNVDSYFFFVKDDNGEWKIADIQSYTKKN